MGQYHPAGKAAAFAELDGEITVEDYRSALDYARRQGLNRLDQPDIQRMLRMLGF
jgi:uncharacterized Fe-S radical SAM superfamily protein PflX